MPSTTKAPKAANGRLPDWVGAGETGAAVVISVIVPAGAVALPCTAGVPAAASGTRVTGISTVWFAAGYCVMFAV